MKDQYGTIRPKYREVSEKEKILLGYEGRLTIGKNFKGKQNQKSFFGPDIEHVKRKMDEFRGIGLSKNEIYSYHIKVKDWTEYWYHNYKEVNLCDGTKRNIRRQLELINNSAGDIFLKSLTEYNLQMIINLRIASGVSSGTVNLLNIVIKECFSCAYRCDFINRDIFSHLKIPKIQQKEKNPLSRKQDIILRNIIKESPFENYIIFLRGSAARKMEGLGICWDNIDFENHLIYIGGQLRKKYINGKAYYSIEKSTKNGVFAPVKAPSYVFEALYKELIKQNNLSKENPKYRNNNNLVFTDENGKPINPYIIDKYVKELKKVLNRADFGLHVLRHTRATEVYNETKDPLIVQALLRHKYLSSTYHYLHLIPGVSLDLMDVKEKYYEEVFEAINDE